jgi:hypothetical protein
MKTITCLAAAAAVFAGVTVAQAQTMGTSPDRNHQGTERSPKAKSGGSVDNPSPRGNGGGTTGQAAPRGSSRPTGAAPGQPAPDGGGTRAPQSDD